MQATCSVSDPRPAARRLRGPASAGWHHAVSLAAALGALACSQSQPLHDGPLAASAPLENLSEDMPLDLLERVLVPPADGPKLAPLVMASAVYGKPDKQAGKIGYLRIGARVARSEAPVSLRNCAGGWYAVRPLGFVCADEDTTLHLDHPLARALQAEPDRSRPMPYAYAFARSNTPNYLRVPSTTEQFASEKGLGDHLRRWHGLGQAWSARPLGANDVPLDVNGLALGTIPDHTNPVDISRSYAENRSDSVPWWLEGQRHIPNVAVFDFPSQALIANRVRHQAGVAVIGSFVAGENAQHRRFAITPDARLLPADKLALEAGSAFHGHDLRTVGLPVGFASRIGVRYWQIKGDELTMGELLERREFVPLSAEIREVGEVHLVGTRDGRWLRSEDLRVAPKPRELPWFATQARRWIDVSIDNQLLVLWEGPKPVYATLVSTGKDGLGDPESSLSTPTGVFRIQQKHVTTTMDSTAADAEFELRDVPWVMYFKGGYALHGAYWHDDFGRMRSHGCVNLSPIDARLVFEWSSPTVPEHWHGAYASESFGNGTLLRIAR
jgi:hypothetical protein